jgi:hypothetical protein
MRIGDVSRQRRFADPARQRWYAYYRAVRFALRMWRPDVAGDAGPGEQPAAGPPLPPALRR